MISTEFPKETRGCCRETSRKHGKETRQGARGNSRKAQVIRHRDLEEMVASFVGTALLSSGSAPPRRRGYCSQREWAAARPPPIHTLARVKMRGPTLAEWPLATTLAARVIRRLQIGRRISTNLGESRLISASRVIAVFVAMSYATACSRTRSRGIRSAARARLGCDEWSSHTL